MQYHRQNRDLEMLEISPNKRQNTQEETYQNKKQFEFQDIDSSIHFEYNNGDSRSKVKNSPFKIYQSTNTERDGEILNDMLAHNRSAQVCQNMNGISHFESIERDDSMRGSRNQISLKQRSQHQLVSSTRSQRSIFKYGIQSIQESEMLAQQLQNHTTQAANIAKKACAVQAQLLERLSSKRTSNQENRLKQQIKSQQTSSSVVYPKPQRLVSNEASNSISLEYGGAQQSKLHHKSMEGRKISTSPSLSGSVDSKRSGSSGGYMVKSSHRVRLQEQKYTKPISTRPNYLKPTRNVKHKECQDPKIINVTRKQPKNASQRRSPEFNRVSSGNCSNVVTSTFNSRQTDETQQNLFNQANQIYQAQNYTSFSQIAVKPQNGRTQKQADDFFQSTQLRGEERGKSQSKRWNADVSAKKEDKQADSQIKRKNLGMQYLKSFGKIKSPNQNQVKKEEQDSENKVISFNIKGSFDSRKLRGGFDSRKSSESQQNKMQRNQSAMVYQQKPQKQIKVSKSLEITTQPRGPVKRVGVNLEDERQIKQQRIIVNPKHVSQQAVKIQNNRQNIEPKQQFYETQETHNMKDKLRFLHQKFGAVMKGYKTRRIYHNNKMIKKFRVEFRELIQFAYILKQDIKQAQQQPNGHLQVDHIRQLLLTSLRDLIHKRQQFNLHFHKLHDPKNREVVNAYYSSLKDENSQQHLSTSSFGTLIIDEKVKVPWISMCKPRQVQVFMPMESLESMMSTYNQSEISQVIRLVPIKEVQEREKGQKMRCSKSMQPKVPTTLKKKVVPTYCKQFINANVEDQLRIKQKAQDHINQSLDVRRPSSTKSLKSIYKEERKSQINSAQRPSKIIITPQPQATKKMSSEQIKNKVLNPEDRRKKIEDSISKYSQERNRRKTNAYQDNLDTIDNQNKLYKNTKVMTFGNTQKQSLCETEFKNSQLNLQIQISGDNQDYKTENTSPKVRENKLENKMGSKINFGQLAHTHSNNKSSSPVRKFKCENLNTDNSYSTMPAVAKQQQSSFHQHTSSVNTSKQSNKSNRCRSGGRSKEQEKSAQRQFLKKSTSQQKRMQYDPKRSIQAAKIQKIQKQMERTSSSIESSGYNPQIIKKVVTQQVHNLKDNKSSKQTSKKTSIRSTIRSSMVSSPESRQQNKVYLNQSFQRIEKSKNNKQVINYQNLSKSSRFISKIPKLTISQERLKNLGSGITSPQPTMVYSKSAIMKKSIAGNDSKISSGPQSSYVSPYRNVNKKQRAEKIMENNDIQDINQKIRALNQQYVKSELNTAQNLIKKNGIRTSSFSPITITTSKDNREQIHNNSISHINIHKQMSGVSNKKQVQTKNLSSISHGHSNNDRTNERYNDRNKSQTRSSIYTDNQQVPTASPGPQKMTFDVKEQSIDLISVEDQSKASPNQFKNNYYYKNIHNYENDSPKAKSQVKKEISIETSPQPDRLTTQKERGCKVPIAITSPDNDTAMNMIAPPSVLNGNLFQLQAVQTIDSKKSPNATVMLSNQDYRFDTFNNNDFGISLFEQDNAALDLGQSSNFNSFSHCHSKRTEEKKHEKTTSQQPSQISSDVVDRSESTFRIQPQVVQQKQNRANECKKSETGNFEILQIQFHDQQSQQLSSPAKSSKKSPTKSKKLFSPDKENMEVVTAVKVKQNLGTFVQKSMKDTNQRRRSKAERKQKSVERLKKSSSRILGQTQVVQQPFIQLSNKNNNNIVVVKKQIHLTEPEEGSLGRKSCTTPDKTCELNKQPSITKINLMMSQSPPLKTRIETRNSQISASKSSNFNYNNVMNIKPILSEKPLFQSSMKSVKSALSGHSGNSRVPNNQIPQKTPERQPKNMEMHQTLQTIQQMLQSVQQQQDHNASPTSRDNMNSMIKGLEKQVGTILQSQLAKQQTQIR